MYPVKAVETHLSLSVMPESTKAYTGGQQPLRLVKKTVEYRCGCKVVMSFWGLTECCDACLKHNESIKRITTEELFVE